MKYNMIILSTFLLFGCADIKHISESSNYTGYDFTKYSSLGFLITPLEYKGDYESIGVLNFTHFPEAKYEEIPADGDEFATRKWVYQPINTNNLIDSIYLKS